MSRNFSINQHFMQLAGKHRPRHRFSGTTRDDFDAWHAALHPKVIASLGRLPERVPLNPEVESEWREGGLLKRRVLLDVEDGLSVTALICRPDRASERLPAILCCHGHTAHAKRDVMGLEFGEQHNAYGLSLARSGFVTIAIDWRGFGERNDNYEGNRDLCNLHYLRASILGMTVLGMDIHDGMRAIDYLCELDFVDPQRIGAMGLSFGGTMATWLAICDPRIKAADVICYSVRFTDFGLRDINFCGSQITPGIFDLCDVPDLHGLIAPRPLLIEIGTQDECFQIDQATSCFHEVEKIYEAAGVRHLLELDLFDGGHRWGGNKSVEFFRKHLAESATIE
jgi:dienelactone hydrolase